MRLFVAVAADEEVKAAAAACVERLRRVPGDFRWVDPRDMHLTLRYFGEVEEARVGEIAALMDAAAASAAPFELTYGALGAFESFEDPRVVWVGASGGREALAALAARLGRDDPRPYEPHLTLGRNRRGSAPPEFVAALEAEAPWELRRPVAALSLYASRPAPFGHAYEILRESPLAGAA